MELRRSFRIESERSSHGFCSPLAHLRRQASPTSSCRPPSCAFDVLHAGVRNCEQDFGIQSPFSSDEKKTRCTSESPLPNSVSAGLTESDACSRFLFIHLISSATLRNQSSTTTYILTNEIVHFSDGSSSRVCLRYLKMRTYFTIYSRCFAA